MITQTTIPVSGTASQSQDEHVTSGTSTPNPTTDSVQEITAISEQSKGDKGGTEIACMALVLYDPRAGNTIDSDYGSRASMTDSLDNGSDASMADNLDDRSKAGSAEYSDWQSNTHIAVNSDEESIALDLDNESIELDSDNTSIRSIMTNL